MANDGLDSVGVPPVPRTGRKIISTAWAGGTVGVALGVWRSDGSFALNLVGSGIPHYLGGRRTLAGPYHLVLWGVVVVTRASEYVDRGRLRRSCYNRYHSTREISRPRIMAVSRSIIRTCGTEYSSFQATLTRYSFRNKN